MRTVAIIQARLGSTRFPRKVLADLHGKLILQHVVERAKQIPGVDDVVIACPVEDMREILLVCGPESGSFWNDQPMGHVFGGAPLDVLDRFLSANRVVGADVVMRLTADCPVLDPVVAGQVLALFHASQPCDFASNDTLISGYPNGWDVAVFSRAALETAAAQATDPADREHLECWFKRPENGMRCVTLYNPEPWTGPKLSIDTIDDLGTVKAWLAMMQARECGKERDR